MSVSDPVADYITIIRNGVRNRKATVEAPFSQMKASICKILAQEGFIEGWEPVEVKNQKGSKFKQLKLTLRYADALKTVSPLNQLVRISKPGRRVYVGRREIPRIRGGFGISIVSTSQGVISDSEARKRKLGGELMVSVW